MDLPVPVNPYPSSYLDSKVGLELFNHSSLFSREKLDFGTSVMLAQYSALPAVDRFVDLACGNGVLGLVYHAAHPAAAGVYIDESYMAIDSARHNFEKHFSDDPVPDALFQAQDGLTEQASNSTDLILCNPPFHQQHVLDRSIAQTLFDDSKRCLVQGGEIWVVANQHLGYHVMLRRLFGNCKAVASTRKFVVLRAIKRHVANTADGD
jgi:16S rRNA (guanine1207-N2)-methyltransferase